VSFSISPAVRTPQWVRYLEVNLGAAHVEVGAADWVLFDGGTFDEDFLRMKGGTAEFPESSATAVLCVERLDAGDTGERSCLALRGPGVEERAFLQATTLDPRFTKARESMNRLYPVGVDLLLVDRSGAVAGIPRTTTVEGA
jgi:alpha-D-ribose 1-methylphosphonate 5-triphosphate synthase subunit PhnH